MQTTHKTLLLASLALSLLSASSMAAQTPPTIYFQENADNYGDTPPAYCNPATRGRVDPIWALGGSLSFPLPEDGFAFNEFQPRPALANVKDFDLLFQCGFGSTNTTAITVYLRDGGGKDLIVALGRNEITVTSKGFGKELSATTPLAKEFRGAPVAIKVSGGTMDVFAEETRQYQKLATVEIPAFTLAGINFFARKDQPFSLTGIVLRSPAALKDNSIYQQMADMRSVENGAGFSTAEQAPTVALKPNDTYGLTLRTGLEKDAVKMTVNWDNGKTNVHAFSISSMQAGKTTISNAVINIGKLKQIYVRPMLGRYAETPVYTDILRDWEKLPAASEHPLRLEFRTLKDGKTVLYVDGSYACDVLFGKDKGAENVKVTGVQFAFGPGSSSKPPYSAKYSFDTDKYYTVDLPARPRAKALVGATSSLKGGLTTVDGIPMIIAEPIESADVGVAKMGRGEWALEVDDYLGRGPNDGYLGDIHFTVPSAPYSKAWLICAVDPDPAKEPILTTRLGWYSWPGSGGNRLADTTTIFPKQGEPVPPNMKEIGTVKTKDGKLPLYLVEVDLGTGKIIDVLLKQTAYLNLDFLGKKWINFQQTDRSMKPDPKSVSAVQILGITLEKTPVTLDLVQKQPGNVFEQGEMQETAAILTANMPAKGTLAWEMIDADGKKVGEGSEAFSFAKAGDQKEIAIPLNVKEIGYYDLPITIRSAKGTAIFRHDARFAVVAKDERQADFDSPFGTWWFGWAHGSTGDWNIGGPLLRKAGIRRSTYAPDSTNSAKYKVTGTRQTFVPFSMKDLTEDKSDFTPESKEKARKALDKAVKEGNANQMIVWHESAPGNPGGFPEELIGQEYAPKPNHKAIAQYIDAIGKFMRANYPDVKIVIGNSGASLGAATLPLRNGASPDSFDYVGMESPAQTVVPERLSEFGLQGMVIASDAASLLAKRKVPTTACYEFTYRADRDTGEQQQADWYMRDALICLANDYILIPPGIFIDCASCYYNTYWGGSGILTRAPWVYPKRAYVAYAALTRVFDRVKFKRQVPTGSTTVYALEFDRADKRIATGLWAARGFADFTIEFDVKADLQVFDMWGRERKVKDAKVTVRAGTSPAYLIADKPIKSISLSNRTFPSDMARAAKSKLGAAFDKAEDIAIDPDKSLQSERTPYLPIRRTGDFSVKQVVDDEKGACVEVALDTSKNTGISKYITEYTTLRLKNPMLVPGTSTAVGAWIKGNSCWGHVIFEIEDAKGEVFKNASTGGWGCSVLDWPGNIAIDFDGWNYVAVSITENNPLFNNHSPGRAMDQWVSEGGDKVIDMPIKIRAVTVALNRKKLDLLDFKDATSTIRLKDVGGIE